jgi:hypothetical protein
MEEVFEFGAVLSFGSGRWASLRRVGKMRVDVGLLNQLLWGDVAWIMVEHYMFPLIIITLRFTR